MRRVVSCTIGILLFSGCSNGKATSDERQPTAEQLLVHEAKAAVISRLRDPNSAQFQGVYSNKKGIVCGSLNAKSGFGGYTGFSAFWFDPKTREVFLYDPDQNWGGKGYDARLFKEKGCSIGSEEAKALEARKLLDESDRRIAEMGNE